MYTNPLHFFPLRSTVDIQKNGLSESDPLFQHMRFLILMLQISYFFNIKWLVLDICPRQTQLIKTIYLLCGGMLIFLTVTIYLNWVTNNFHQQFPLILRDENVHCENNFAKKI